jgi:hypothetical protein
VRPFLLHRKHFQLGIVERRDVANPLSEQRLRNRGNVRDHSLRGVRLILADNSKRLGPSVVSAKRHAPAEQDELGRLSCLEQLRARPACREVSQIAARPRHRRAVGFQIGARLRQGNGLFRRRQRGIELCHAALGHEIRMRRNRPLGQIGGRGFGVFLFGEGDAHRHISGVREKRDARETDMAGRTATQDLDLAYGQSRNRSSGGALRRPVG